MKSIVKIKSSTIQYENVIGTYTYEEDLGYQVSVVVNDSNIVCTGRTLGELSRDLVAKVKSVRLVS